MKASGPPRGQLVASLRVSPRQQRLSVSGKVPLAERACVGCEDYGLVGIDGAQTVIEKIRERRSVTKLSLSYNSLGNAGTIKLMEFLCTTEGAAYQISELRLISNSIGDDGLAAITRYLKGNVHLKDLYLQANEFGGAEELGSALGLAVNNSRLSVLNLGTNRHITTQFFKAFISSLDSSALRELHISHLGLKAESSPVMIEYLTCSRSRGLKNLTCNANDLGEEAVGDIIRAIKSRNFNLLKVDLYASWPNSSESEEQQRRANWEAQRRMLEMAKARNGLLHSKVLQEALDLLRYSRALLLPASRHLQFQAPQDTSESVDATLERPSDGNASLLRPRETSISRQPLHIFMLPTEILHHILSFVSPTLSSAQHARIFTYAAQLSTLPTALPVLWHSKSRQSYELMPACLPDPSSLPFGTAGDSLGLGLGSGCTNVGVVCSAKRCMGTSGSVFCQRVESRMRCLEAVGCTHFDVQGLKEEDVLRLLGTTGSHI